MLRHQAFLALAEDERRHGGKNSYRAVWAASEALGIKPESVYAEIRRYRRLARERFLWVCEAPESPLRIWLQERTRLEDDLVEACERLHSDPPPSEKLAVLASLSIPLSVYLAYLKDHRGDPELAKMWARTSMRRPVHVRKVENHKVDAEGLFRVVTSHAGSARWIASVEESPVIVRPGWGSPIAVFFDDKGFGRLKAELAIGEARGAADVTVRIVLTPTRDGTRLEMLVEEASFQPYVPRARRRARLDEWWLEVVLPELIELVEPPRVEPMASRSSPYSSTWRATAWPTPVHATNRAPSSGRPVATPPDRAALGARNAERR